MNVIVDTPVWSLALRRRQPSSEPEVFELAAVIRNGRAMIIGAIRQELLTGVADESNYQRLREHLRAFPNLSLNEADFEDAAAFFNQCRARGIAGSNTDFLICAAAV